MTEAVFSALFSAIIGGYASWGDIYYGTHPTYMKAFESSGRNQSRDTAAVDETEKATLMIIK